MEAGWAARVAFRAAWSCLRHHRGRSLLTMVICGLGTAGVFAASILSKANIVEVKERFRTMGGGLVVVSPNKRPPYPGRPRQLDHFISMEPEDGLALRDQVPQVRAAVPVVARSTTAQLGRVTTKVRLVGTSPEFFSVRGFALDNGRFLAPADDGARVVVLGHAVSHELVAERVISGMEVYLAGQPYQVIGALQPQGVNFAGEDEDHQVFIPLETYRRRVANRPWLNHLYLQLAPEADTAQTTQQIQILLRDRHGRWSDQVDDALVRDLADLAAREADLLTTTTWAVSVASALLLALGVVGIGTLMLLVVRERRKEIALRRAVGATPADVALQFFLEGMALSLTGALAGLLLSCLGAGLAVLFQTSSVAPDGSMIAASLALSLACSAAASALPALLAARTEPGLLLRL